MVINITVDEVKCIVDAPNTTVIDVRTPEEFCGGTLESAVNINLFDADFADQIKRFDREGQYLMLCLSGTRSGAAAEIMEQLGFKNVANIIGGIMAWDGNIAYPKAA